MGFRMEDRFSELVAIMDRLLGPNGCPWDQEQTLKSLRKYVLEESCEVIDAINEGRGEELCEELGDLFLNCVFLSKLAEKEGYFQWHKPLETINEKLIRRHPHIFGSDEKLATAEEVLSRWEEIKKTENKTTAIVPKEMPALARAEKLLSLEKKKLGSNEARSDKSIPDFANEEELGNFLLDLVLYAKKRGFHSESALRGACGKLEKRVSE